MVEKLATRFRVQVRPIWHSSSVLGRRYYEVPGLHVNRNAGKGVQQHLSVFCVINCQLCCQPYDRKPCLSVPRVCPITWRATGSHVVQESES